ALFEYAFGEGSRERVWEELERYQNEDGGFGRALEPDFGGTEGGSTDKLFHSFCRGSRRLPVSNSTLRSIRMACWLSVVLLERHHIPPALNDFATPVNLFLKNTAADQLAAVFLSFKEIAPYRTMGRATV